MTDSTGKTGRGITFEIADSDSPTGWTAIANATSIAFTGRDAEQIDFTHLASSGGFREQRQGFKSPGSVQIQYHYTPTEPSHVNLLSLWLSGATLAWRINYSGAGWPYAESGRGFVQNPGDVNVTVNDPITGAATVAVTGETSLGMIP